MYFVGVSHRVSVVTPKAERRWTDLTAPKLLPIVFNLPEIIGLVTRRNIEKS